MTPEQYQRIKQIYSEAATIPAERRHAFLDVACGNDAGLRREVGLMLQADEDSGFLKIPALQKIESVTEPDIKPDSSLIGTRLSHYKILNRIGTGGMGEVYLAEDTRLARHVALKLLPAQYTADASRVRRFEQEARTASALNHPNIVTIHEIGEAAAGKFIVMEHVRGRTLRETAGEAVSFDALIAWGSQIARAIGVAHGAGITHRDIKPENIMVRDDGLVKVLDFGLARLAPALAANLRTEGSEKTAPGMLLGTVRYMSPEQTQGETVTMATDIFSLGLILYELATGRHPFQADKPIDILHAIASRAPLAPSRLNERIPAALNSLILRMLEKDALRRPDAPAVEAELHEIGRRGGRATLREGEQIIVFPRPPISTSSRRLIVGREKERAELFAGLAAVNAGHGLLMCVAGEPGIGKTTIVEDFLAEISHGNHPCHIARGRCSERLAGTEAYLPLLEALDSLLTIENDQLQTQAALQSTEHPDGSLAYKMKHSAPTWYAQVAPSGGGDPAAAKQVEGRAASQEKLKRELCAFLQDLSQRQPLILFFDDLHWADISTIDLLAFLAARFDTMRVLIVVAYRPSDLLLAKHPFLQLKPDLQARGVCREIPLDFLSRAEIEKYLALQFPEHRFGPDLSKLIHAKTEGSPLFMADLVRYLRDHDVIAKEQGHWTLAQSAPEIERDLPESVRGMIERKIAQLSEEDRRLLVAAGVQGYEFDSAIVARVLAMDPAEVEERLEALERVYAFVRLIEEREFPDRTLTLRYRFVHVLYQNALYATLQPTRKAALSAAAAEALLTFQGKQNGAVASELARLFEAARKYAPAADYYLLAARNAAQVFAYREMIMLADQGLAVVELLPETPERIKHELALQLVLGPASAATKGFTVEEVERAYARARELSWQIGDTSQLLRALYGLYTCYQLRGEMQTARELAEEWLHLAESRGDPSLLVAPHARYGQTLFFLGQPGLALEHQNRAMAQYSPEGNRSDVLLYGTDHRIVCLNYTCLAQWLLGYPDQALESCNKAVALARQMRHPFTLALALQWAGRLHQFRREARLSQEKVDESIAISTEHGFPLFLALGAGVSGAALAEQGHRKEGIAKMRQGLAAWRAMRSELSRTLMLSYLADALGKDGQVEEGFLILEEALALAEKTGECFWQAELLRLKGESLLNRAASPGSSACAEHQPEAEAGFRDAIEVARQQGAKSLELRAATSLARLWKDRNNRAEARAMLAEIYGWFTEGFETPDLKDARALLDQLS